MWNDIRYAFRMLRRKPAFAAAIIATVALAIGANTAIFSVVNAVLLRPLPFAEPGRLIQVAEKNDRLHLPAFAASLLNFLSWREQTRTFDQLGAVGFATYTLTGSGEPEQLTGNRLTVNLMRVLGLKPIAGRDFTDDEEKPNSPAVVLIGEDLWKRRFGSDPGIIGRTVTLNSAPVTVVGIAPPALKLLANGDVYTPMIVDPAKEIRLNHVIVAFGRLRPGVTLQQAQSEMDAIAQRVGQQYPDVKDWGIQLISLFDTFVSPQLKTGLLVLLAAVAFVLLIACANIANLLLARAAARQKEMATRTALGASRSRLIRQLLIESVMVSVIGGSAGLLLAVWAVRLMNRGLPPGVLPVPDIHVDPTVLTFAAAITLLTGVLFGLAPAWRTAAIDINEVLKLAGRGTSGGVRTRLRNALAAGEIAVAALLLIGAGLLIQSLAHLQRVRLGFDANNLLTFQIAAPGQISAQASRGVTDTTTQQFDRTVLDALASLPGVQATAMSSGIPFGVGAYNQSPMTSADSTAVEPETALPIDWRLVSSGYFHTMGIPLLRGREFTEADGPTAPQVVIVSQATAKKFWGDQDPIGHTLHRPHDSVPPKPWTVVGVVGDVRSSTLNQESPALYWPIPWRAPSVADVVVRTSGSPTAMLPAIRQRVHDLNPSIALANVRTMDEWLSNTAAQPRLSSLLLTAFAALAMLIAAVGIYGVLAYSVNQRTQEIGLRMAFGATPQNVLRLVLREGAKVIAAGLVAGLITGLALGRVLQSLVFGVTVRDPTTYAIVAIMLAAIAMAACAIPARRAARLDPMAALHYE